MAVPGFTWTNRRSKQPSNKSVGLPSFDGSKEGAPRLLSLPLPRFDDATHIGLYGLDRQTACAVTALLFGLNLFGLLWPLTLLKALSVSGTRSMFYKGQAIWDSQVRDYVVFFA